MIMATFDELLKVREETKKRRSQRGYGLRKIQSEILYSSRCDLPIIPLPPDGPRAIRGTTKFAPPLRLPAAERA
jgi:hypothetical protein